MAAIDNLISSLESHLNWSFQSRYSASIVIFAASQNIAPIFKSIVKIYYKVRHSKDLDIEGLSNEAIHEHYNRLKQEILMFHSIQVEVYQKPYPMRQDDFITIEQPYASKIYYDLDVCEDYLRYVQQVEQEV